MSIAEVAFGAILFICLFGSVLAIPSRGRRRPAAYASSARTQDNALRLPIWGDHRGLNYVSLGNGVPLPIRSRHMLINGVQLAAPGAVRFESPSASRELSDNELNELLELCETNPKEGLARIDRLDGPAKRQPAVKFCRVVAFRRLIYGSAEDFDRRYGTDYERFLREIDREKRGYARQALVLIAEIERVAPSFFSGDEWRSGVADVIGVVIERHEPGVVQNTLGWTKLYFFGPDRVLTLDRAVEITERLHEVPDDVLGELVLTRFSCPLSVRSAIAVSARHVPHEGWIVLFALFAATSPPKSGKLGNAVSGFLTIGQGNRYRFERPGEAAGGPLQAGANALPAHSKGPTSSRSSSRSERWSLYLDQAPLSELELAQTGSRVNSAPSIVGARPVRDGNLFGLVRSLLRARTGDRLLSRTMNGVSIGRLRKILERENCKIEGVRVAGRDGLVFVDFVFAEDQGNAQIVLSERASNETYGRCAFKAVFSSDIDLETLNDLNSAAKFARYFSISGNRLVIEFDVLTLDLPDSALAANLDLFHGIVASFGQTDVRASALPVNDDRRRNVIPTLKTSYRATERCTDTDGNEWEAHYIRYDTDVGYDEVIQVQKNGTEVGHTTYHYDKNGNLLRKNEHGTTNAPCRLK